jgi:hypothetical protein
VPSVLGEPPPPISTLGGSGPGNVLTSSSGSSGGDSKQQQQQPASAGGGESSWPAAIKQLGNPSCVWLEDDQTCMPSQDNWLIPQGVPSSPYRR